MTNIRRALEARRGEVERSRSVAGGIYVVEGIIELWRVGEATVDVRFPVTFVEMPVVIGGGGVSPNQRIVPGEFPTWRVGVREWDIDIPVDTPDSPTYKGCTLVIVVDGARDDQTIFQSFAFYQASGRALTNPTVDQL
jgi:hypothetical protein